MKSALMPAALGCLLLTTGCASITGTPNQSVSVQTREAEGKDVAGANCELANSKGKWLVTSPGSVTITRSNDELQVTCSKAGLEPGRAAVVSATKGSMFGNIIFGGGIGALVDHNTGAAYEYPSFLQIVMGAFTKILPSDQPQGQPAATQQPAAAAGQSVALQQSAAPPNEERLRELQRLHSSGLISQEVYLERQKAILAERR